MANEVNIKINADDMASGKISGLNSKLKSMRGTFLGVAAAGGAVTGILGMMTKSSLDQQIGINQLDNALKNVNTSYAEQKTAIEEAISATQSKTNFGDEEQRESLAKIIALTGDNSNALDALAVSTDLASAMGMDLSNASLLVSKALSGQASSLTRYGIQIEEGATNTEILATLQEKFAGSAEAAADPTTQLGNRIGDLAQSVGDVLLPVLETLVPMIDNAVQKIIAFSEENPTLTKTLVIGAGALGAIALALGTLGLVIPPIITAITGLKTAFVVLKIAMMSNPFVAIATVLIALATITIPLVIKNFDKIKNAVADVVNAVMPHLEAMAQNFVDFINVLIDGANKVKFWGDKIDHLGDVTFPRMEKTIIETTDVIKDNTDAMKENADNAIDLANQRIQSSQEAKEAVLEDLEEIANFEKTAREERTAERKAEQAQKEAIEKGDTTTSFDDFLARELAKVKGMRDVIDVGGRNMSNDLANAFRNFAAGSQVSEHGQAGRDAQNALFGMMDTAGYFKDSSMPMLTDMIGSPVTAVNINRRGSGGGGYRDVGGVQVFVEGDVYGMDDFDRKVNNAVQTGIQTGVYTEDEF